MHNELRKTTWSFVEWQLTHLFGWISKHQFIISLGSSWDLGTSTGTSIAQFSITPSRTSWDSRASWKPPLSRPPLPAARLMRMFRDMMKSSTFTNLSTCVFYKRIFADVDGNGSPLWMSSVLFQTELMMGSSLFAQH